MDLQAVIVFVGGFAFCAVVGYIVSVFGAKEQASLFVVGSGRSPFVNIVNLRPLTSHCGLGWGLAFVDWCLP